jgi:hypothetical protein
MRPDQLPNLQEVSLHVKTIPLGQTDKKWVPYFDKTVPKFAVKLEDYPSRGDNHVPYDLISFYEHVTHAHVIQKSQYVPYLRFLDDTVARSYPRLVDLTLQGLTLDSLLALVSCMPQLLTLSLFNVFIQGSIREGLEVLLARGASLRVDYDLNHKQLQSSLWSPPLQAERHQRRIHNLEIELQREQYANANFTFTCVPFKEKRSR